MSEKQKIKEACGGCEGVEWLTPVEIVNAPGLRALIYRMGTHPDFKESMLRSLTASSALRNLTTREDDDASIALIDAWALTLDILSFYQERIANEGFLGTSRERLSIFELARHISYRPKPGLAAHTWLSFFLDEAPGAPTEAQIPAGTKVQSIPGQDEKPQLFETIEGIQTKTKWNAIKPRLKETQILGMNATSLYLQGADNQLQPGDQLLLVGNDRYNNTGSEVWDIRTLQTVSFNYEENYTLVTWQEGLGHINPDTIPEDKPRVFVFKQMAALFGYNAPDWNTLSEDLQKNLGQQTRDKSYHRPDNWPTKSSGVPHPERKTIYLDAAYPKILEGSWLALMKPGYMELYNAKEVIITSKTDFTLTTKTTRILLDTDEHLSYFPVRKTAVLAQSEELKMAEKPIETPLLGKRIPLNDAYPELKADQPLIVRGEPLRFVKVTEGMIVGKTGQIEEKRSIRPELYFIDVTDKNREPIELHGGEILELTATPETTPAAKTKWFVKDADGNDGYVIGDLDYFISFVPEEDGSKTSILPTSLNQPHIVREVAIIDHFDPEKKEIFLKEPLKQVYLRHTVNINANVVPATHGESKTETLGGGDGAKVFQKFHLKQKPLTYISATSAAGIESTLEIRVNDIKWKEVPAFYGRKPNERIYITRTHDDGSVYVQFGDGITGARLPSGLDNVRATYRVGIGLEGQVRADQLSMLLTPQLGVKTVSNPVPASGAEGPETLGNIRRNAPQTVRTLDRIVSIQDFEDFANAYAGIGKARADLLQRGEERLVFITVASADQGAVDDDQKAKLAAAINAARHDNFPVRVDAFNSKPFPVAAKIKIHEDYLAEKVIAQVKEKLLEDFGFEARDFGQDVTPSEVITVIQSVDGVMAVDLDKLGDQDDIFSEDHFQLKAEPARWEKNDPLPPKLLPADLLLIDPEGIKISESTKL